MASTQPRDFIRLYRHLLRLCKTFPEKSTLNIRELMDTSTSNFMLPYNSRDSATRALRTCLTKNDLTARAQVIELSDTETAGSIDLSQQPLAHQLPFPDMPENMELARKDMLHYLRRNFDLGKQYVADAPVQEQDMLAEATATRAIVLGDFFHWQMLIHEMSSVQTTCFQGLLPPELDAVPAAPTAGSSPRESADRFLTSAQAGSEYVTNMVRRSVKDPGQGHTTSAAAGGEGSEGQGDSSSAAVHGGQPTHSHDDSGSDSVSRDEIEQAGRALQRSRELRDVHIELERVNKLYKRKTPLVRDANAFEALCMSRNKSPATGPASTAADEHHAQEAEDDMPHSGLERQQAKLRIQATPFPASPEDNDTGLILSENRMLFYYQIMVENIGDVAVQLLGRYHEISCPWDVITLGTRAEPRGHRTEGVVLMPGAVVMEQQYAVVEGSEGIMRGGFLCRMLPLEIAKELERLAGSNIVITSERMKLQSLDPDCHFLADIGEMTIRRLDDRPFSERLYESITGHSDGPSDGGYSSDEEEEENEMLVGEFVEDLEVESDVEVESEKNK